MSESDLPDSGPANDTALTVDQGAAAIEGLLSRDPVTPDPVDDEESQTQGQDSPEPAQAATEGDDDLNLEDVDVGEGEDGPGEQQKYEGGRFAADDANVTLPDGRVTTVAELKRNTFFQRDYTEKMEAVKQEKTVLQTEKQSFEAARNQFAETQRQIEQQRAVILTVAQELLPQEPQPVDPNEDPGGYLEYLAARDAYFGKMQRLQFLVNANQQEQVQLTERQKQEQAEQQRRQSEEYAKAIEDEKAKLHAALPKLKDDKERAKFVEDAVKIGQSVYGITPDEIGNIVDHRYMRVFADAIAFRKAVAKAKTTPAPGAPAQAQQPRIQQKQRMAPTSPETRDSNAAIDRLRKTGSIQDAAKALMKFV